MGFAASYEWDFFLSYASEDREFVRDLALALQRWSLSVWFDEERLTVGDSIREAIDYGLSRSRYGVIVLSRNFLSKPWPRQELGALVALENGRRKTLLPIWHGISAAEVRELSPLLADRFAASSDKGVETVARYLIRSIGQSETVFEERLREFSAEKRFLAQKFTPLLLRRCLFLAEKYNQSVDLFLDAGTSVYAVFEEIGKLIGLDVYYLNRASRHLQILTTNFRGLQALMSVHRGMRLYPDKLNLNVLVLPGVPRPSHSAISGEETVEALEAYRQRWHQAGHCSVSLVAAKWVSLFAGYPTLHMIEADQFIVKQSAICTSDEVFVIVPRGKCSVGDPSQLESRLRWSRNEQDPDRLHYITYAVPHDIASKLRMVTTTDPPGLFRAELQRCLTGNFLDGERDATDEFVEAATGKAPHIVWRYDTEYEKRV